LKSDIVKDFLVSKAFAGIVVSFLSYFFGEQLTQLVGLGWDQTLMNSGVIAGLVLMAWSRWGTAVTQTELKSNLSDAHEVIQQVSVENVQLKQSLLTTTDDPAPRPKPKPK